MSELARLRAENDMLRALIFKKDRDRRLWFIGECLATKGRVNRSDLIKAFDCGLLTAQQDLGRWQRKHPNTIRYNSSTKRYELIEKGKAE